MLAFGTKIHEDLFIFIFYQTWHSEEGHETNI